MLQLILIVGVLVFTFYYFAVKPMSYWKNQGVQQGKPMWLFGDQWGPVLRRHSFAEMVLHIYNAVPGARYSGVYQFTTPTLLLRDVDLIKQIGVKDFDHFMDHRTIIPEEGEPLWGKNIISLKGQKWRDIRPVLSPSFTSSKMRAMFVLMSECAQNFSKFFLDKNQDSIEIEMRDISTRYANDVIATTAFGIKVDSLANQDNEFYVMGKEVTNFNSFGRTLKIFGYMLVPKLYSICKIGYFSKRIRKFFLDLIDETIRIREEKGIVRPDMIHLMMEAKKGIHEKLTKEKDVLDTGFAVVQEADLGKGVAKELTNMDIAAHALIFFFGGFESVASLMCFMSYELAVNPDIQKKLREEIEFTLENCNGKLTYEALLKMEYLDMVITESLRKWPNGTVIDRVCTKPYTIQPVTPEENPVHLSKGSILWIPIFAIHRDPQYYPNPDRFDPERFSNDNKANINPNAFIPFGTGPRNCIGSRFALLETKVWIFFLLASFEIVPNAKLKIPLKLSKKQINIIADGGFWFNLKRLRK